MTVCIGATCERGTTVVVAADKMVTFGAPMNLQTEPRTLHKITKAADHCLLLFSGSVSDGEEIIGRSLANVAAKDPIVKIGETVRLAYADLKKKRVEEQLLLPILGADFAKFQTLVTQSSSSQILQQVTALIMQHNLQAEVLIAGVDASGSHLFAVIHPGTLLPLDTTGYAAIGTGGLHAAVRLSLGQQNKDASLVDTIYNVYESKKASEVAPGVGKLTDMAVIKNGAIHFAQESLFELLEKVRKERPSLSGNEQAEIQRVCDGWTGKQSG